jgi:hypothetical protein
MTVETVVELEFANMEYDEPIARNARVVVSVSMASSDSSAENAAVVLFASMVDKKVTAETAVVR